MSTNTAWTKDRMIALLEKNDLAVERALVVLFDRQTQDEKRDAETKHTNARGFRKNHDHTGSYYACIILKGWKGANGKNRVHLNPVKLGKARSIVLHYHRQLCEEANAKATKDKAAQIEREEDARERRKSNFAGNDEF